MGTEAKSSLKAVKIGSKVSKRNSSSKKLLSSGSSDPEITEVVMEACKSPKLGRK
jgi:hypothetical protein